MDISPYISTLATLKDVKPVAHFSVSIPDTPRFKGKPLPSNRRFVSVTGILTGVILSKDGNNIQRFMVTMEQITFGPKLDDQKEGYTSPMKTPALSQSGKGPINFSRKKAMSAIPLTPTPSTSMPSTPTPSTPTPSEPSGRPSRKRARTDTTDNSSDPFLKENIMISSS